MAWYSSGNHIFKEDIKTQDTATPRCPLFPAGQIYARGLRCSPSVDKQVPTRHNSDRVYAVALITQNGSVSSVDIFQWAKSRLKISDFLKEKENTVQTHQYRAYEANLQFSLTHWFSQELEVFSFRAPLHKPLKATLDSEGKKYLESAWCLNLFCSLKTEHFKKHFPMLYLVQLQVFISNKTVLFLIPFWRFMVGVYGKDFLYLIPSIIFIHNHKTLLWSGDSFPFEWVEVCLKAWCTKLIFLGRIVMSLKATPTPKREINKQGQPFCEAADLCLWPWL